MFITALVKVIFIISLVSNHMPSPPNIHAYFKLPKRGCFEDCAVVNCEEASLGRL